MQNFYLDQIDDRKNNEMNKFRDWYQDYNDVYEDLQETESKLKDLKTQNEQFRKIIEKHIDVD